MKHYFLIGCWLAITSMGYSQDETRWGLPQSDSSCAIITYTKKSGINSRHATIVYTKTVSAKNLNPGNIISYTSVSTITIVTGKESYSYAASNPTVSLLVKRPGTGTVVLLSDAGGNRIFVPAPGSGAGSTSVAGTQATYVVGSNTSQTFSIAASWRSTINSPGKKGTIPAWFTHGSISYTCNLDYLVNGGNDSVQFSISGPRFPVAPASPTIALQSIQASFTPTASLLTSSTATLQLSVNIHSYTPVSTPTSLVNLTKYERRNMYENHLFRAKRNAGIFYLSVGVIPSVLNRQVLINRPSYNNYSFINHTKYDESSSYNVDLSGRIGIRMRRKAIIFVEAVYGKRGFKADYDSINPFSGTADVSVYRKEYKADILTIGFGYSYNWYIPGRFVNPVVEAGFYSSNDLNTIYSSPDVNNTRTGIKLSAGIALKSNVRHDFKIMPTFSYDFAPYVKNDISTRFYSLGLSISYGVALFNYGKK